MDSNSLSRRGFITMAAATAAVGTARAAGGKPADGPRDYSHPERLDVPGVFGDGTRMYCLSNRSRSMMLSTVFVSKDGHVAVIDGGEYGDYRFLAGFLQKLGGTVDWWFLTHAHEDHFGALSSILKSGLIRKLKVNNLVYSFPDVSWYEKYEAKVVPHLRILNEELAKHGDVLSARKYVKGEHIRLGDSVDFEVLNDVDESITFNAVNNSSICMTATIAGKRILVTGDLGAEAGDKLVADLGPTRIRHDILFMPHHGQSATTKAFFEAVRPTIAIWPTTDWIWDNVADFGVHGLGPGPGSGNLNINYYKCWLQEVGVRRQYVLTKDVVIS